jgi:hypothetical protein
VYGFLIYVCIIADKQTQKRYSIGSVTEKFRKKMYFSCTCPLYQTAVEPYL